MKIALIGSKGIPAQGGGIERHVEEQAVNLAKLGHEVLVYSRKKYTKYNKKEYKGVKLVYLPSLSTKNLDAITHTLLSSIDVLRRNVDIVHYHGVGPATLSFIPRLLKRKAKTVVTFHCQDKYHQKWSKFAQAYLGFGEYAACKFPHKTIVISKTLRKLCKDKYNTEAEYIPNGVAINNSNGDSRIKKFGLEKDKYIVTCARLVRHKGTHYLIKAFNKLNPKGYKLAIVGDSAHTDDYVKYIKKLAFKNKNIVFTGFQEGETLSQLFENAYMYVHPSEAEGLSITVLEAMAYKKSVLVSNIPENIEAFAGRGFMFVNKDVKDLTYKMLLLLDNSDLVKRTGEAASEYVLDYYDWNKIINSTINVYKESQRLNNSSLEESIQKA